MWVPLALALTSSGESAVLILLFYNLTTNLQCKIFIIRHQKIRINDQVNIMRLPLCNKRCILKNIRKPLLDQNNNKVKCDVIHFYSRCFGYHCFSLLICRINLEVFKCFYFATFNKFNISRKIDKTTQEQIYY